MEPVILASESPRRQDYFRLLGLPFTCIPSMADESFDEHAQPQAVVEELALRKVNKIAGTLKNERLWVCGADTIIAFDGKIYGKPLDREDARQMLRSFAGRDHQVWSAVALYNGRNNTTACKSVGSTVSFAALTHGEIEWYLDTDEWRDAAGSYKIQGLASCFIEHIEGSYSGIVGLPLREFYAILRENGYPFGG